MTIKAKPHTACGCISAFAALLAMPLHAESTTQGWLQTRDQNPFVLATGLSLAPVVPAAGKWQFDASLNIANTELGQGEQRSSLIFDAETRETRISLAYSFNERWSARASIGHFAISDGVLDSAVERFHRTFGFSNGDRGLLATNAPAIEVEHDGIPLYSLQHAQSGMAPTLIDLTRSWSLANGGTAGISLGAKLPTGSRTRLSDSESTDLSFSAFSTIALGDHMNVGARLGMLHQHDNRLLGNLANEYVPFGSLLLSYRLDPRWTAIAQIDAHGPLYEDLPDFFHSSSLLSFGLSRRFGERIEFVATLGEDVPATHTTDIVLNLNFRIR